MTDEELEGRLRAWYRAEVGEDETASLSLRQDIVAFPRVISHRARWFGRGRPVTLLAAAALLLVGGAVATTGSGLVRLPSLVPPEPAPTLPVAVTTPTAVPTVAPTAATGMFAFIKSPGGDGYPGQVWVANTDGTAAHQLAPDLAGSQGAPSWSRDGTRLVFSLAPLVGVGYPDNGAARLYLTDASGSAPQLVDTGCVAPCSGDSDAAFSSDGTQLVFVRTLGQPPTSTSSDPAPSKLRSSTVASVLATIDLSTGRTVELASTTILAGSGGFQNRHPRWSPDGTQIVFTQDVPYDVNGPEINGWPPLVPPPASYVVDANGGNLHQISPSGWSGDWSPDGARIVFGSVSYVPVPRAGSGAGYWERQYFDIYTIRPDGTGLRRLTSDRFSQSPSWSTDGRIWFERLPNVDGDVGSAEPRQFWLMDADGSNAVRLSLPPQFSDALSISWPRKP